MPNPTVETARVRLRPPHLSRALCAAACWTLAACRTWQPVGPAPVPTRPPAEVVAAAIGDDEQPIRLTTARGEQVILLVPRVEGDSVVGAEPRGFRAQGGRRRAVALADVAHVEAWRVSTPRTAVSAVVIGTIAALALLVLFAARQVVYD